MHTTPLLAPKKQSRAVWNMTYLTNPYIWPITASFSSRQSFWIHTRVHRGWSFIIFCVLTLVTRYYITNIAPWMHSLLHRVAFLSCCSTWEYVAQGHLLCTWKPSVAILQLNYLDESPIFESERRLAEAWTRGGHEVKYLSLATYYDKHGWEFDLFSHSNVWIYCGYGTVTSRLSTQLEPAQFVHT